MEIIDHIYDAVDDEEVFALLPDTLAKAVGSRSCTLQMWSPQGHVEDQTHSYFTDEMNQFYLEHGLDRHDMWAQSIYGNISRYGSAQLFSDLYSVEDFTRSFFYNEFLRPFGDDSAHCLGFINLRPDGGLVAIGTHRSLTASDFGESERNALGRIGPHFVRMSLLRQKLKAAQLSSRLANSGLNAFGTAVMLLRVTGRVEFSNDAANDLMFANNLIFVQNGKIAFHDKRAQSCWIAILSSVLRAQGSPGGAFLAQTTDHERWHVHVIRRDFTGQSAVMVMIERGTISSNAETTLRELFGLTAAESRAAIHVAQGLSGPEIANLLGVKESTIRTQVAHVYSKLGITKSSDLVRIIAALPPLLR